MDRVGRFLWLPWETGTLQGRTPSPSAGVTALWGERDGYRRLSPPVTHRRALVQLDADSYLIVDCLQSAGRHDYRLHWLLEDYPHEWQAALGRLTLQTPAGVCYVQTGAATTPLRSSLVRADAHSARGWQSRHYLELSPALSLALDTEADATVFWSLFSADDVEREQTASGLLLRSANWTVRLALDGARDIDVTQPQTQGESLHVVL